MDSEETFDRQIMVNPRKKGSRFIRVGDNVPSFEPKIAKRKSVPVASSIVHPCTECGKQFYSWKALFGHMRCHPERQWRGINPPLYSQGQRNISPSSPPRTYFTEVDQEVATSLLMLANGSGAMDVTPLLVFDPRENGVDSMGLAADFDVGSCSNLSCRFECSSCKKVFGSHQALGGHRASHKNVKGCFAVVRNVHGEEDYDEHYDDNKGKSKEYEEEEDAGKIIMTLGHQCGICFRVFPSGQALGGHKRCHWEKGEDQMQCGLKLNPSTSRDVCCLDLNLPAPVDDTDGSSCSAVALDLKLGI